MPTEVCSVSTSPVYPDQLVRVRLQQKPPEHVLHAAANVALRDPPQPGIHAQGLPPSHVIQGSIKLGAIANLLLDLDASRKQCHPSSKALRLPHVARSLLRNICTAWFALG